LFKQGLVQDCALAWVGQLERIDLGLPAAKLAPLAASQPLALRAADGATAPWPPLDPAAGKYGRGRLLVVAGSPSYPGAAQLCLQGASASGCGSLKALGPEAGAPGLWASQPHVVGLDPEALALPRALERFDAVVFGPGLGPPNQQRADPSQQHLQQQLWDQLQGFAGLLLLDADGLNRLADLNQTQGTGASQWLRQRQGPTWLTPHGAEFDRLFPDLAGLPPLEAAAAAAQGAAATVLLKGAHSVIAAADGRRWQLIETCPDAARAGLGDVLAGYAAGRGAMAVAAGQAVAADRAVAAIGAEEGSAARGLDGALLAAAALSHGQAGWLARLRGGPGGATPMAVAAALATQSFDQSAEIRSESDAAMGQTNAMSTDGSQY
jgi:NAD(P)H-hydrate epimerase